MIAQAMHAAVDLCMKNTQLMQDWWHNSNTVVVMECASQDDLFKIEKKAIERGIEYELFREPDMNNEATAIALFPCDESRKITSNYRLALKEKNGTQG